MAERGRELAEGLVEIRKHEYRLEEMEKLETNLVGTEYIARIEFDILVKVISAGDVIYEVPFKANITVRKFGKFETLADYENWKRESVEAVKRKARNIMTGWDTSKNTSYQIELDGKIKEVRIPVIGEIEKAELSFKYVKDVEGNIIDIHAISFIDGSEHRTPTDLTRHLQRHDFPYQSARFFGDVYRMELERIEVQRRKRG